MSRLRPWAMRVRIEGSIEIELKAERFIVPTLHPKRPISKKKFVNIKRRIGLIFLAGVRLPGDILAELSPEFNFPRHFNSDGSVHNVTVVHYRKHGTTDEQKSRPWISHIQ